MELLISDFAGVRVSLLSLPYKPPRAEAYVVEVAYEGCALAREVGQRRKHVHWARLQDVPSLTAPQRVAADFSRPGGFVLQHDRNEHRDRRGTEEGQQQQGDQDRLALRRRACCQHLGGLGLERHDRERGGGVGG